jgi:hypothetical protein
VHFSSWNDSVQADAIFRLRQLLKLKAASAAAILSLGVAICACDSAFRRIDAMLLRPSQWRIPSACPCSPAVANFDGKALA